MIQLKLSSPCLVIFTLLPLLVGFSKVPDVTVPPAGNEQALGDCKDYNRLKNPYFGDLHVHTTYSFDAIQYDTRNDPDMAYRFAKGEPLWIPPLDENGQGTQRIQLDRPLDFTAVTDHAEGLAEVDICFNKDSAAYFSPYCIVTRGTESEDTFIDQLSLYINAPIIGLPEIDSFMCYTFDLLCDQREMHLWKHIQTAAEEHNDRSDNCNFTTFVGYEWTATPLGTNLHRNIIFKNEHVIETPIGYDDVGAGTPEELWRRLDAECTDEDPSKPCEVIAIPHNSNLGGGEFFNPVTENKEQYSAELSAQRQRLEPLVEIYQHKGASECQNGGNDPLASEDELCDFEVFANSVCTGDPSDAPDCMPLCSDLLINGLSFVGRCLESGDFVRGGLRKGLVEEKRTGVNPFKFGFIGSTDTHNSTPGYISEDGFLGHVGTSDGSVFSRLAGNAFLQGPGVALGAALGAMADMSSRYSAGGLAVLWAEQNSRSVLFDAMKRREAYATSGPRIVTRFFGGWGFPENMCEDADMVANAYASGVPMGGDLPAAETGAPTFLLSANMDIGTEAKPGIPLQRVQIIKGWEENGETFEKVYDVLGDPNNGASVDIDTCETQGSGFEYLCGVWTDPDFSAGQSAFYYTRVVENPSCRWSRYQCNDYLESLGKTCETLAEGNSMYSSCCTDKLKDIVQERAWTSPIWYTAE